MNTHPGFTGAGYRFGSWNTGPFPLDTIASSRDHTVFPQMCLASPIAPNYVDTMQQNAIAPHYSGRSVATDTGGPNSIGFHDRSQLQTRLFGRMNRSQMTNFEPVIGTTTVQSNIQPAYKLMKRPNSSTPNHLFPSDHAKARISSHVNNHSSDDQSRRGSHGDALVIQSRSHSSSLSRRTSPGYSMPNTAGDVIAWQADIQNCTSCDISTATNSDHGGGSQEICNEHRETTSSTLEVSPIMISDSQETNSKGLWDSDCHTGDHPANTHPSAHMASSAAAAATLRNQAGLLYPHVMIPNVGFTSNLYSSNSVYSGCVSGDCSTNSCPFPREGETAIYSTKQQEHQPQQQAFTTQSVPTTMANASTLTDLSSSVIVNTTSGLQIVPSGPHIHPLAHGSLNSGFPVAHTNLSPTTYMMPSSMYNDTLSMTIWHFFITTRQSQPKYAKKLSLRNALHMVVSGVFENAGLFIVGSSMNGFGSDQSDMDMCLTVTSQELQQKREAFSVLSQLLHPLRQCSFIRNLHLIRAKVPILKFRDTLAGVDCDLNVNNVVGIYNTHLLAMYTRIDWRVRPLGMFVKYWAQRMDIHDGSRGRLSTYPLLLMLIHYLQSACSPPVLPNLQAKFPKLFNYARPLSELDMALELPFAELRSTNPASLGELFVGFIHYYSNEFDFTRWAISILHGAPLPIDMAIRRLPPHEQAHTARSFKVFVEEPFCQNNAARSLYDDNVLARIRQAFLKTHQCLRSQRNLDTIWINSSTDSV